MSGLHNHDPNSTAAQAALILCAGKAIRWGMSEDTPKQLVVVDGEPLLNRTVRLLLAAGVQEVVIVGHDESLILDGCGWMVPTSCRWTVETLWATRTRWKGRTCILLGDVWFSEEAIASVATCDSSIAIFGRLAGSRLFGVRAPEIFGMSFDSAGASKLKAHAHGVIKSAEGGAGGRILDLYASLTNAGDLNSESPVFREIDDLTSDFDSPEEYRNWLEVRNQARLGMP